MSATTDHRHAPYFRCAVHEASHLVVNTAFNDRAVILFRLVDQDGAQFPEVAAMVLPVADLPSWPRGERKDRARMLAEYRLPASRTAAVILAGRVGETLYAADMPRPWPDEHNQFRSDDADLAALELSDDERREAGVIADAILSANRTAVFAVADWLWLNSGRSFWASDLAEHGVEIVRPEGLVM